MEEIKTFLIGRDYTKEFVGHSTFVRMEEDIDGKTEMDFYGLKVMNRYISTLAELVYEYDVVVEGLDKESRDLLDSHLQKMNEPDFEDLDAFKKMFEKKFPKGRICIWDKILYKAKKSHETNLSLVMVDRIENHRVHYRLYYSHLMEPKHVYKYGGLDNEDMYKMESAHLSEFANKEMVFRYPKDDFERQVVEVLESI